MKIITSILIYFLIIISIMQNWLWLAGALVLLYSYKYGAESLILIALLIDGYYGNFYTVPYLSLAAVVWYLFVSSVRNRLVRIDDNY